MANETIPLQLDWDAGRLQRRWPNTRDNEFIMRRIETVPVEATAHGARGRVLEVAAAEAVHSCKLSLRGLESFVLEPSPAMLEKARERIAEYNARVTLVRGIAETLPFAAGTFDRVLCDSAIDHLADPALGIREMTRVLKPDGLLVISFVNYGSLSTRVSRLVYHVQRRTGGASAYEPLFWDTPVPVEHTFECTYPALERLCGPYLELDRAFGVSMGWMVPGWGALLAKLGDGRAERLLRALDRIAGRVPRLADFVLTVWRPRHDGVALVDGPGPRKRAQVDEATLKRIDAALADAVGFWERVANEAYTGRPERSWLDDVIARGPFRTAATLGCERRGREAAWLRAGASEHLDVYEQDTQSIRETRAALRGQGLASRRVHFVRADLNCARLPRQRYDVIWSGGCLHYLLDLEHLLTEVEQALRPGGLFAVEAYVGERRLQYTPARLEHANRIAREIPQRFRRGGGQPIVSSPPEHLMSTLAVRSDEIVGLAKARFDLVHEAWSGALLPLYFAVDIPALEHEAPEVLERLVQAEQEAVRDPSIRPCRVYLLLRRRS